MVLKHRRNRHQQRPSSTAQQASAQPQRTPQQLPSHHHHPHHPQQQQQQLIRINIKELLVSGSRVCDIRSHVNKLNLMYYLANMVANTIPKLLVLSEQFGFLSKLEHYKAAKEIMERAFRQRLEGQVEATIKALKTPQE
ncbi:hypothetical protein BGZ65_005177 [Modicella reniformis]|uniref:Uncharacterized protein n=1 Tax=Modicella reniformis TaxID=1440133 RepID=A0A9P6IZH7_9FUNG|nr:hypothetical protein BGZ65_005177 [Modicella reniformis]